MSTSYVTHDEPCSAPIRLLEIRRCLPHDPQLRECCTLVRGAWKTLLAAEPRLRAIYPAGIYRDALRYDPALVPPFAELMGAAQCDDDALTRTLAGVAAREDAFINVAYTGADKLVGCVVGWVEELVWGAQPQGHIEFVYVDPDYRRLQVCQLLTRSAAISFAGMGCRWAWGVLLNQNSGLLPVWRALSGEAWANLILHDLASLAKE